MSASTATPSKAEGKVIAGMLKDYQGLVAGTSALSFAFIKKHKAVVQRDIEATLKEGQKAGEVSGIRPTYSKQFSLAGYVLENKWAFPANVADFMTVIEVFHRAFGAKNCIEEASKCKTWAEFVKVARSKAAKNKSARDKAKADKGMTGASQGNAEGARAKGSKTIPAEIMAGELVVPDSVAGLLTVGMALRFFSNRLDSAVDVALTADEIILAEKVSKRLASLAKIAKSAHPSKGAKVKA